MQTWKDVTDRAKLGNPLPDRRVEKTAAEWRQALGEDRYRITRERGTERAFSSDMCALFAPAVYRCACCGEELFDGRSKFESHSGWPSFTQPIRDNVVSYIDDRSYGMQRIETICSVCDAHLGHVFPDGPAPSGLRFCINALALEKVEAVAVG